MASRRRKKSRSGGGKRGGIMGWIKGIFSIRGVITLVVGGLLLKLVGGKAEEAVGSLVSKVKTLGK